MTVGMAGGSEDGQKRFPTNTEVKQDPIVELTNSDRCNFPGSTINRFMFIHLSIFSHAFPTLCVRLRSLFLNFLMLILQPFRLNNQPPARDPTWFLDTHDHDSHPGESVERRSAGSRPYGERGEPLGVQQGLEAMLGQSRCQ